jgi:uncharacterized protein YejL (UPF0352 family)
MSLISKQSKNYELDQKLPVLVLPTVTVLTKHSTSSDLIYRVMSVWITRRTNYLDLK